MVCGGRPALNTDTPIFTFTAIFMPIQKRQIPVPASSAVCRHQVEALGPWQTSNVALPAGDSTGLKRADGLWFGAEDIERGRINLNGTRGDPLSG
jgi:hypothetical protein